MKILETHVSSDQNLNDHVSHKPVGTSWSILDSLPLCPYMEQRSRKSRGGASGGKFVP